MFLVLTSLTVPEQKKTQSFESWFVDLDVLYPCPKQLYHPTKTVLWMWEHLARKACVIIYVETIRGAMIRNQPLWILSDPMILCLLYAMTIAYGYLSSLWEKQGNSQKMNPILLATQVPVS